LEQAHITVVVIQPLLAGVDGRCFHNLLRQEIPAVNNSLGKEKLPGVKSAMLLVLLQTMTSCVLTEVRWLEEVVNVNIFFTRQDLECFYEIAFASNSPSLRCCQSYDM